MLAFLQKSTYTCFRRRRGDLPLVSWLACVRAFNSKNNFKTHDDACRVLATMAAHYKGTSPPCTEPRNFVLSEQKIQVSFQNLFSKYDHEFKNISVGTLVYDTKRKALGSCLYMGFKKGMRGTRCTIQGDRRNSHSDFKQCIPLPPLFSHVKVNNRWFEVVEYNKKHAHLSPCLEMEMDVDEDDVEALFNNSDDDESGVQNVASESPNIPRSDDSNNGACMATTCFTYTSYACTHTLKLFQTYTWICLYVYVDLFVRLR